MLRAGGGRVGPGQEGGQVSDPRLTLAHPDVVARILVAEMEKLLPPRPASAPPMVFTNARCLDPDCDVRWYAPNRRWVNGEACWCCGRKGLGL